MLSVIYLDNAATTKADQNVVDSLLKQDLTKI
ncbi:cysteine desulfurase [Staphylococcus epidermidis]|nr:cysteine desulfurase [Staphylococcus epidermidis]